MKKNSKSAAIEDTNETIKLCNDVVIAAGKKPLFDSIEELEKLMSSTEPIKL